MPVLPPAGNQGQIIREEIELAKTDQGFILGCAMFLLQYAKDAATVLKLSDPPEASKSDPDVQFYLAFRTALLRAKREGVAWGEGVFGNPTYVPDPQVHFEGGGSGLGGPPPDLKGLFKIMIAKVKSDPGAALKLLNDPDVASDVAALKAALNAVPAAPVVPVPPV